MHSSAGAHDDVLRSQPVTTRRPPLLQADGEGLPEVQALFRLVAETGQTSDWSSMLVRDQLRDTAAEGDDNYIYGALATDICYHDDQQTFGALSPLSFRL